MLYNARENSTPRLFGGKQVWHIFHTKHAESMNSKHSFTSPDLAKTFVGMFEDKSTSMMFILFVATEI